MASAGGAAHHGGAPKRRLRPVTAVLGAVGAAVVLAGVLVAITLATGSHSMPRPAASSDRTPASAEVIHLLAGVSQAQADRIGWPGDLSAPKVLQGQPALTYDGKPGALYIGAEFCPYCAADMWPMVLAFSRFGHFDGLTFTTSSAWDVHPSTATFSFYGSTYVSDYVTFETVEAATTDTSGPRTHRPLQTPSAVQQQLWRSYSSTFGSPEGYPFLDIGNGAFLMGAPFDPSLLAGLDQRAIALRLSNPDDPVARAVIGSANVLTASICASTGGRPAVVCQAAGTVAAAKALGT